MIYIGWFISKEFHRILYSSFDSSEPRILFITETKIKSAVLFFFLLKLLLKLFFRHTSNKFCWLIKCKIIKILLNLLRLIVKIISSKIKSKLIRLNLIIFFIIKLNWVFSWWLVIKIYRWFFLNLIFYWIFLFNNWGLSF